MRSSVITIFRRPVRQEVQIHIIHQKVKIYGKNWIKYLDRTEPKILPKWMLNYRQEEEDSKKIKGKMALKFGKGLWLKSLNVMPMMMMISSSTVYNVPSYKMSSF
jgi:hypothetical protein